MSLLEQTPGLQEALQGETLAPARSAGVTPKFLATRSVDGVPNVVPCVSILPADDQPDTVFFGNFLLRKSIKNLQADARVGVLVITPELRGWILKGDFVEFQRTGPYVERQMSNRHPDAFASNCRPTELACWKGSSQLPSPPAEALVAANILTFEAISYQAKGRWSASGRTGTLQVQQVYAGGPPYPGGRVA